MSRSRYYNRYPRYVPVAEKEAKAAAALKRLCKSRPDLQPVILAGKALARTWWGKGWNINLERYADYSNRIGRGRAYLRHGAVLDLVIEAGEIRALVQGSRSKPYEVVVAIKPIGADRWEGIKKQCRGRIEALPDLLAGRFPTELAEIFMAPGAGLFPAPAEINFQCSCPDWASMCKHVAATLYGIGARLDEEPTLFFKLRQVEMSELISGALQESSSHLLAQSTRKSERVLEDTDLGALFGIELAEPAPESAETRTRPRPTPKKSAKSADKRPTATTGKTPDKGSKQAPTAKRPKSKEQTAPGMPKRKTTAKSATRKPPPATTRRATTSAAPKKPARQAPPAAPPQARQGSSTPSKEELCAMLEKILAE